MGACEYGLLDSGKSLKSSATTDPKSHLVSGGARFNTTYCGGMGELPWAPIRLMEAEPLIGSHARGASTLHISWEPDGIFAMGESDHHPGSGHSCMKWAPLHITWPEEQGWRITWVVPWSLRL